jgi:hypothetical protein
MTRIIELGLNAFPTIPGALETTLQWFLGSWQGQMLSSRGRRPWESTRSQCGAPDRADGDQQTSEPQTPLTAGQGLAARITFFFRATWGEAVGPL